MSAVPRIPFDALSEDLMKTLKPRVERLGYFGEFFQCAAHQPEALLAFNQFTESAKRGLPKKIVETIALTCAVWMENKYELHQHERLSVRLGFGREWVAQIIALNPDQTGFPAEEALVQKLVLTMLDSRGLNAGPLFEETVSALGEEQAIAILMVVGRYIVHGLFVNTLKLSPPVPSIFEDGFTG